MIRPTLGEQALGAFMSMNAIQVSVFNDKRRQLYLAVLATHESLLMTQITYGTIVGAPAAIDVMRVVARMTHGHVYRNDPGRDLTPERARTAFGVWCDLVNLVGGVAAKELAGIYHQHFYVPNVATTIASVNPIGAGGPQERRDELQDRG